MLNALSSAPPFITTTKGERRMGRGFCGGGNGSFVVIIIIIILLLFFFEDESVSI